MNAVLPPAGVRASAVDFGDSPLGVLGIDNASERAYRAVLRHPGITMDELGQITGRAPDDLRADVEPLLDLDLIRVIDNVVQPEPPSFALRMIVSRQARAIAEAAQALESVESHLHRYVDEHQIAQRSSWKPLPLDVIPEPQLIDVMQTLVATTTGEMLFLRPDQWSIPDGRQMDGHVIEAVRSGRPSRTIYPFDVLEQRPEGVQVRAKVGEQIKLLNHVPSRLAVFGVEAVVLPDRWGAGHLSSALLVREQSVVAACRALFEQLWHRATAVPETTDRRSESGRRQLLDLLASGAKDEQISRALGISLRTVRRRVADTLAELGVDSRFQAGMEAVRRGWL